jgi:[protein-PII] uridylyltransferase
MMTPSEFIAKRTELISSWGTTEPASGVRFCAALSDTTDHLLRTLFADAVQKVGITKDIALIAVGGYGRGELAPYSDLDLLLLHKNVKKVDDVATALWYPLWDLGLKVGHAVRTPKETRQLGETDLDTATALVTARFITGDEGLASDCINDAREWWRKRGRDS